MPVPLLEGRVEPDEITALRRRVEKLDNELADALEELTRTQRALRDARAESATALRGLSGVRKQLAPIYGALQQLFGEMDAISGGERSGERSVDSRVSAAWEAWKSRLGGGTAKVIDALLLHGEMNTTQLSIATGLHRTTIPALIFKLNKASLINKNNGKFSLKEI